MMASLKGISAENLQKYYSSTLVEGFESVAEFPGVTEGLLSRGYRPEDVKKIMGGNWLRLFERVWRGCPTTTLPSPGGRGQRGGGNKKA